MQFLPYTYIATVLLDFFRMCDMIQALDYCYFVFSPVHKLINTVIHAPK